ncbi:alanine-glyoxylate transaminase/serine-glyoxylate transaminase/serine-pyruvate transaminase [Rhodobacter viridis]|uniref:Alanine-glyoxylate transaminase/serine-glyoxylate transaminase/serine-pyruvate transaminase n=1 Tax=Rhodobacter viridis TaxID=1054202 RepID=A0A318TT28_9RHOB|nr:aminotransferase class V-fold PLP-dependent enzyme [Rhodobacter viridis]PYF07814.1 alanine-glyoxylate transaminase/serine-glyoxylate transaminase/serine-pyruvate transaminase [Rhodobacter viridis]
MSLAQGRSYLAIPGPSVMPDRVLNAMHRAAPNIYGGELIDLTAQVMTDLRRVAMSSGHVAIYLANGHGAWEAAISNLFSRGDTALSLITGRFGVGWAHHARSLGVTVETIDFGIKAPVDPARVEAALRADTGRKIKVVLLTHVDTASSVLNDVAAVRAAIDAAGHPALLAVDCIASLGCDEFRFDDWGVDVMVAASQKGLMVPPGLGIVWISDKAVAACKGADLVTPYWDWTARIFAQEYWQQFGGTAPTHHIFGLSESLKMILDEEGLPQVWARHRTLARTVAAAFDAWGQGGDIRLNVPVAAHRSGAVTAARIGQGGAERLRNWCETQAGVTLGIGLGMAAPGTPEAGDFLRVAHMGHVNAHMTLGALAVMEAGLQALAIPHGTGGIQAAAAVIAAG